MILVGIAGGTASGKTTVAHRVVEQLREHLALIEEDGYYKDISHLSLEERAKTNFDHPDSIDFALMRSHLLALKRGESIPKPTYDFKMHARNPTSVTLRPERIVVVEGILIFAVPEIRELFDIKIYVDADDDIRLLRRMKRDIEERGRTFQCVCDQYLNTVRPMHDEFVEPSKRFADVIIPRGGENETAINILVMKLKAELHDL